MKSSFIRSCETRVWVRFSRPSVLACPVPARRLKDRQALRTNSKMLRQSSSDFMEMQFFCKYQVGQTQERFEDVSIFLCENYRHVPHADGDEPYQVGSPGLLQATFPALAG